MQLWNQEGVTDRDKTIHTLAQRRLDEQPSAVPLLGEKFAGAGVGDLIAVGGPAGSVPVST